MAWRGLPFGKVGILVSAPRNEKVICVVEETLLGILVKDELGTEQLYLVCCPLPTIRVTFTAIGHLIFQIQAVLGNPGICLGGTFVF